MTIGAAWTQARARLSPYRAQLRFCLRMTAAALLAFALAQIWNIPLNGLWSVLTAVVVTQMSVGGSLRATTEYVPPPSGCLSRIRRRSGWPACLLSPSRLSLLPQPLIRAFAPLPSPARSCS